MLPEQRQKLVLPMARHQHGRMLLVGEVIEEVQHAAAVDVVEALGGFVEDEQRGLLDEGAGDQGEALLAVRQMLERHVALFAETHERQPALGVLQLRGGRLVIEADGVEEAGNDDLHRGACHAVVAVQLRAHNAEALLEFPDGLTAATPFAEQGEVVAVALRVVAGEQAQQGRFAGAVGPGQQRVAAVLDSEFDAAEDDRTVVGHRAVA